MFDIRDHGGVFGSGKYRKNQILSSGDYGVLNNIGTLIKSLSVSNSYIMIRYNEYTNQLIGLYRTPSYYAFDIYDTELRLVKTITTTITTDSSYRWEEKIFTDTNSNYIFLLLSYNSSGSGSNYIYKIGLVDNSYLHVYSPPYNYVADIVKNPLSQDFFILNLVNSNLSTLNTTADIERVDLFNIRPTNTSPYIIWKRNIYSSSGEAPQLINLVKTAVNTYAIFLTDCFGYKATTLNTNTGTTITEKKPSNVSNVFCVVSGNNNNVYIIAANGHVHEFSSSGDLVRSFLDSRILYGDKNGTRKSVGYKIPNGDFIYSSINGDGSGTSLMNFLIRYDLEKATELSASAINILNKSSNNVLSGIALDKEESIYFYENIAKKIYKVTSSPKIILK